MLEARFVPLQSWPKNKTPRPERSRFRSTWQETMTLLENELRRIRAKKIVVQIDLPAGQIRNDGWPYSSAKRPKFPGVILSFECSKGSLAFPCDRFDDWKDNLLAIGLSLEALHTVDRYGVTQSAEQYRGWTALPPPAAEDDPYVVIAKFAVVDIPWAKKDIEAAYRLAVRATHPDHGGKAEDFNKVQQAINQIRGKVQA